MKINLVTKRSLKKALKIIGDGYYRIEYEENKKNARLYILGNNYDFIQKKIEIIKLHGLVNGFVENNRFITVYFLEIIK